MIRGSVGGAGIWEMSIGLDGADPRCNSEPLDGPGSDVGTMPMSSRSLPWRSEVDRAGEVFVGDDRREEVFRPGRRLGTSISSRGRFGADRWAWGPAEDQRLRPAVVVSASHVWRGAFEDEDEEVEGVGSVIRGS